MPGVRWVGTAFGRRSGDGGRRDTHLPATSAAPAARAPQGWAAAIKAALAEQPTGPRATLSFDEAIALVCGATSWPIGHAWIQMPTGWRSSGAWYASPGAWRTGGGAANLGDQVTALRETSAITDLGSGRGIVAAVLHLESCRFLPGLEGLGSPLRQAHATALRLSGVVGVPVRSTVGGHPKVTAVLEFVTAHEIEPDGALAEALLDVADRTRRRPARKQKPTAASPSASTLKSKSLDIEIPDNLAG